MSACKRSDLIISQHFFCKRYQWIRRDRCLLRWQFFYWLKKLLLCEWWVQFIKVGRCITKRIPVDRFCSYNTWSYRHSKEFLCHTHLVLFCNCNSSFTVKCINERFLSPCICVNLKQPLCWSILPESKLVWSVAWPLHFELLLGLVILPWVISWTPVPPL